MQKSLMSQSLQKSPNPSQHQVFDFDNKSPGGINDALLGITYQVKLLMLFAYNAWKNNYKKFCLDTEIKTAGKFDDLCFKYDDGSGEKLRLLQAKHKKIPQAMTLSTLLFDKNFSLLKYFGSSQTLKKFSEIEDLIVCTNNLLNFTTANLTGPLAMYDNGRKIYLEEVPEKDDIICLGKRYKFVDSNYKDEWERTRDTLYYYFVAQELADFVLLKKKPTYHFLETFESELTSFIVDPVDEKFRVLFLENCLPHLTKFHEILEQVIENILKEDPETLSKKLKNKLKQDLWSALENVSVKFSDDFFQYKSSAKQDLELFMEKFMFVVEMDQSMIDKEIMDELGKELNSNDLQIAYKLFESYISDWVKKGAKGEYLTESKIAHFFRELNIKIKAQQLITVKMMLLKNIQETNIEFEHYDRHGKMAEFLYNSEEDVIERIFHVFVPPNETFFGSIRVYNCLVSNQQFNFDDSSIFLTSSLPQDQIDMAVEVFALPGCFDLCILECDNGLGPFQKLKDIVSQLTTKKLIVVGHKIDFPEIIKHSVEFQQETKLSDISERSLEVIFSQKSVTFQKEVMNFDKIVKSFDSDVYDKLKLADFLELQEIASNVLVSKPIDQNIFIERKLIHQIYIKNIALKDNRLCLAFSEDEFMEKVVDPMFSNVHLLGAKNPITGQILDQFDPSTSELFWKSSSGDVSNLRKYFEPTKGNEILPQYFCDPQIQERVIVISECGGMGKTFFLNNLSSLLKKTFPEKWIIKLDLNDYTDLFEENRNVFNRIDHQLAIKFLVGKILHLKPFERQLFMKNIEKGKRVTLIFDGFDEISPDYTTFVLNWINSFLRTKVERIFIATRNEMSEILQNEFSIVSHKLVPFNDRDQENFLVKYYASFTVIPERKLRDISREIIKKTMPKIGYIRLINRRSRSSVNLAQTYNKQFAGIPLISMLIAECFRNELKKLSRNAYEDQFDENGILVLKFIESLKDDTLNPFELYQKFIPVKPKCMQNAFQYACKMHV